MKTLLALPLIAVLAGCVVAPPAPPMIARLPQTAAPDPNGWRVVSVTPVSPGQARDANVTVETLPEQRMAQAPSAAAVPQQAPSYYVQPQPVYLQPQPVYVPAPVYYDPWPLAVGVGLSLGWWGGHWCCHHGYRGSVYVRGRH